MKIAYGVHGYGRGHAMRALAVLPELARRHEVLVLAGGDAYSALRDKYDVVRLPLLAYQYNDSGRISHRRTGKHNLTTLLDLKLRGATLRTVTDTLSEFGPDVIVSDSEMYTHRAGKVMGIPRISFDHFGLLVHCKLELGLLDRVRCWGSGLFYRMLFGRPDRVIVSSFFTAPARRDGVCVVGAVIRPEVRRATATDGEHLLVYVSKGQAEYNEQLEGALLALDCPVRVYGTDNQGQKDNIEFKPISNEAFIADLASCRAVLATTGNQLLGEVIYFSKPMLGMPIDCLEQRLNGRQIEKLGIGRSVSSKLITAELLRDFLANTERFSAAARHLGQDGERQAIDAIETFAAELAG